MVASMSTSSKSGASFNALKRLSQTPARDQRRKRVQTDFQCPGSGGRSRQGVAPRASQRQASTNRRLSAPLRPRSPALPGTNGSIRARCASVRVRLLKIASVFDLEQNSAKQEIPQMKTPPKALAEELPLLRPAVHAPGPFSRPSHQSRTGRRRPWGSHQHRKRLSLRSLQGPPPGHRPTGCGAKGSAGCAEAPGCRC